MVNRIAEYLEDPVAAYDCIAPAFDVVARQRQRYNLAVEALIAKSIPHGSRSLLDVGAGDGQRAQRIANAAGIASLTLVEPSAAMRSLSHPDADVWPVRAELLRDRQAQFDVITCLWNVLGHIFPAASRVEALRQFARLAGPQGRIFVDVQHRYNARQYGFGATILRFLRDRVLPAETNGDVQVTWNVGETSCATAGHVFTHREFARLCKAAGLNIEKRFVIDYDTGQQQSESYKGNLLYMLRPA